MIPIQPKQVICISQESFTNAATATGNIDTKGFAFASIDVLMATSDDTTNSPTVFKLAECDTTVVSSFADIAAFVGDDSDGWDIPDVVTSGDNTYKFNVDLRGRKRYLRLSISPLTTQVITAIANLFHGAESPNSIAKANVLALVEG